MLRALLTETRTREEWAELLGTHKSTLINIMQDRRCMNVTWARSWAKRLRLTDEEATRFVRLAGITHIPRDARAPFISMVYELETLRRLAAQIEKR